MDVAEVPGSSLDRLPTNALGIPELDVDPAWRLAAAFLWSASAATPAGPTSTPHRRAGGRLDRGPPSVLPHRALRVRRRRGRTDRGLPHRPSEASRVSDHSSTVGLTEKELVKLLEAAEATAWAPRRC